MPLTFDLYTTTFTSVLFVEYNNCESNTVENFEPLH